MPASPLSKNHVVQLGSMILKEGKGGRGRDRAGEGGREREAGGREGGGRDGGDWREGGRQSGCVGVSFFVLIFWRPGENYCFIRLSHILF